MIPGFNANAALNVIFLEMNFPRNNASSVFIVFLLTLTHTLFSLVSTSLLTTPPYSDKAFKFIDLRDDYKQFVFQDLDSDNKIVKIIAHDDDDDDDIELERLRKNRLNEPSSGDNDIVINDESDDDNDNDDDDDDIFNEEESYSNMDDVYYLMNDTESRIDVIQRMFNFTWPIRESASVVDGQLVLGALHMIHERSEELVCGRVMVEGGIQALEVMLYTLDHVNGGIGGEMLIPGVRLGVLAKDDCDTDIFGLEQALDFIRGSITNLGGAAYKCPDGSIPKNEVKVISGVLGAPSSVTSIQVANLLKLFKIPQISFFSTSSVLSNRERFPFFLRTIPSDVYQAEAIVALVKFFQWKYVSVIYEESSYGMQGFNEVDKLLRANGICLALREKMLKDSGVGSEKDYDLIVDRMLDRELARGVIIFASDQEVAGLMRAVRRRGVTGKFAWIGSDGWGGRGLAYKGNEEAVEGAVSVQPLAEEIQGFRDYFLSLKPDTNKRNPWFIEYWEHVFQCRYPGSPQTPFNGDYNTTCTGQERLMAEEFELEQQLQFVSDSVMAFAYAFKAIHRRLCGGVPGMCERMKKINGEVLRAFLLRVKFRGLSNEDFHFLSNGDPPSRYRILNFRKSLTTGEYEWATVGFYRSGHLNITSPIQFRATEPVHPPSICSHACGRRQYMDPWKGEDCCWTCKNCLTYEYRPVDTRCEECPMGTVPAYNMTYCIEIPVEYLKHTDPIGLVAMAFSTIGILATCAVAVIFLKYSDTPVVKASGRELSFVLLSGILLCYAMTFLLLTKPTKYVCGSQIVGIGFCFAVCYSAILTKTNRISRIFRAGKRTIKRPKFISPESQLIICASLVACQIIISLIWLLTSPPNAVPFYATRADHQLVCEAAIGFAYMIGFSYPIFLVLICTFYAIKTRKIPEAFNESQYIGFTMYTTCIIWAAFVVIFLSTSHSIRVRLITMCFSISLSATVTLICMFTPKLYIILFRPDRNVRQSMMVKTAQAKFCNSLGGTSDASVRVESGTQSDDYEMSRPTNLTSFDSVSSGLSRSTNATQTYSNAHSISTQTLNFWGDEGEPEFDDNDVEL